jgi:hypothetical protein
MMSGREEGQMAVTPSDRDLVLSSLERDQLAGLKKRHIPRRQLKGHQIFVLWSLRIYLIFMMVVVVYQVWTSTH